MGNSKWRKMIKRTLVVVSGVFLLTSCGQSYTTRVDATNGYEIDYPSDWDTTNSDPRMSFVAVEEFVDTSDIFGEQFNISIFPHGGASLVTIVDQNVGMARRVYGDLQIDRSSAKNENGVDYIQLKMPYSAESLDLLNQATFITNDTYLFTITEICEEAKLEKYQPIFDQIINSFNWVE